jgi:succinyl-CoA:(S)-malate CoA-transferase subunit A
MRRFGSQDARDDLSLPFLSEARCRAPSPSTCSTRRAFASVPEARREVRRPHRELPPGDHGGVGPRLGRAARAQPRARSSSASRATGRRGPTATAPPSPTSPTPTRAVLPLRLPRRDPGGAGDRPLGDYMSSLYGAIGVLIALRHREATGAGRSSTSRSSRPSSAPSTRSRAPTDCSARSASERARAASSPSPTGTSAPRTTSGWPSPAPPTACSSASPRPWGAPSSPPTRCTGQMKRRAARDEVNELVVEWVETHDRDEFMRICLAAQVPCGKLNSIADIFEDEHFQRPGMLASVDVPGVGEVVVPNVIPAAVEDPRPHHQPGARAGRARPTRSSRPRSTSDAGGPRAPPRAKII